MNESNNYALNISTYKVTIFYPYTRNLLPEKIFTHTGSFIIVESTGKCKFSKNA